MPPQVRGVGNGSVSALWIGGTLSWVEQLCLRSFVAEGYSVNLYVYESVSGVPAGVKIADGNEILPEGSVFENHSRPGSYAGFSNIFRYQLLQQKETIWIDADVLALGAPMPVSEYVFGWESRKHINGAVLGAPRDSQFLNSCLTFSTSLPPESIQWGQIGPRLVTEKVFELGLEDYAVGRKVFYPIDFRNTWRLFDPREFKWCSRRVMGSTCLHLWNEVIRGTPVKQSRPHPDSFLGSKLRELALWPIDLPELNENWVRNTWRKEMSARPFEKGFMTQRAGRLLRATKRMKDIVNARSGNSREEADLALPDE